MMKTFFNFLQNTMKKQKIAALKNGFLFKKSMQYKMYKNTSKKQNRIG